MEERSVTTDCTKTKVSHVSGGDPDMAEVASVSVEAEGVSDGGAGHRAAAPPLPLHGVDEAGHPGAARTPAQLQR